MNFHFVWKGFNVVTGKTEGMYEQTIYGETLVEAVDNFTAMHGELSADENDCALEILSIKEVQ